MILLSAGVFYQNKTAKGDLSFCLGTLHDTFTLNGNNGSIKLSFNGLLKPTADPDLFIIEGNWYILSGTDSYKDIVGQGKGIVMINFTQPSATSSFWGQIKFYSQ